MIGSNKNELRQDEKPEYLRSFPFFIVNLLGLAGFYYVFHDSHVLVTCVAFYYVRMFFITGFQHRYFSHRSFKINGSQTQRRITQFLMMLGCTTAVQNGPLWWAFWHRHHHRKSDQPEDVHSYKLKGFYWSHVGWILCGKFKYTDYRKIADFAKYPELRALNRPIGYLTPPVILGFLCFYLGGVPYLMGGFFTSTFILYHGTFCINSVAHMWGTQRWKTGDESRNNGWLNILTLGEGWHNNHHHEPQYEAQAITWAEKFTDVTHWLLWLWSKTGMITIRSRS